MLKLVAAALAAAMMALAACGGGDNGADDGADGGEDFVAQANEICVEAAQQRTEVDIDIGAIESDQEAVELVERVTSIEQDAIDQLQELNAPDEATDAFQEFISLRQQATDLSEEAIAAAEQGDTAGFDEVAQERQEILDEAEQAAAEAGLEECARALDAESEQAITDVIELAATTADTDCAELYTESYIAANFDGNVEACNRETATAETVEVMEIEGIAEVSATAEVSLEGGELGGQEFTVDLLFQDGSWKVDQIRPLDQQG